MMLLAGTVAAALVGSASADDVHYRFDIVRSKGAIYNPWTQSDDPVELRSFRGSGANEGDFIAPTIRVAPGQQLTIDLDNRLEPCTEKQRREHICFNDTNLHTHGLWVSPSGNSDNVLISIAPGERFRYQYQISSDHPAGTFWYHPHRHGSGFVQVGSGMAGALIVTGDRKPTPTSPGDIDILLKDEQGRAFPERVMLFQQIQYGCLDDKGKIEGRMAKQEVAPGIVDDVYVRPWSCAAGRVGRIENAEHDWDWVFSGRFTGINGKVQPRMEPARVDRFERWRLIHGGTREPVKMQLRRLAEGAPNLNRVPGADQEKWIASHCTGQPLSMWQIAMDGLTRSAVRRTDVAVLFPGDRMDVLVRFPAAGRYCLIQNSTRVARNPQPLRALAMIEAGGRAAEPDGEAALSATLVRSAERALPGADAAAVRAKIVADLRDGMKLAAFTWHKPVGDKEIVGYREAILNILETSNGPFFHINGRPYDHKRMDMELPLGRAEEWHAIALLGVHPLHMHVNPFQIVTIENAKGEDLTDPKGAAFDPDYAGLKGEWKDTIALKQDLRVVFRTRYERFTGDFVTHCHVMFHGDHGMMLNLRIAAEGEAHPAAHK
ncbi:MAG TPA: multicopper oxidase domain-containing protein [Sphingomicrobium sp.]|nr:multicopper oxidase domain-containing protein [Sphingomicrobium sp.]